MKKNKYLALILGLGILVFCGFYFSETGLLGSLEKRCKTIANSDSKNSCWRKVVDKSLLSGDLGKSMDVIAFFYEDDPEFSENCHDFVHLLGKDAYRLFSEGKNFSVSPKTSYCSYGFYHGFMESLVGKSGDIEMARRFCDFIDSELSKDSASATLACFHGIGHGWANIHDEKLKGDERAMVYPALDLCQKVTQDPEELKICATGVFDSISLGYYNNLNGLVMNKKDPFWLCWEQEERFKTPCYMDLGPAILWLGGDDLKGALNYLPYVESEYKELEVQTIAENSVNFIIKEKRDVKTQIEVCRSLGGKLYTACIKGLSGGFLQFSKPGREHEQAIGFCQSEFLNTNEKETCYEKILNDLVVGVSSEKYEEICSSTGRYEKYCLN